MSTKDFKKRLEEQKRKDEQKMNKHFSINDKEINVNCNNLYIRDEAELYECIEDIMFTTKGEVFKKNKIFDLQSITDVNYNLQFLGSKDDNKLFFKVIR